MNLKPIAQTPASNVPTIISSVVNKAEEWKLTSIQEKISILEEIRDNLVEYEEDWIKAAEEVRGVCHSSSKCTGSARADIIASGPGMLGSHIQGFLWTLKYAVKNEGNRPPPPKAIRKVCVRVDVEEEGKYDNDDSTEQKQNQIQSFVTVWPNTILDHLEAVGLTCELQLNNDQSKQKTFQESCVGGVAGILGAGNIDALYDVMCQMFLYGRVCIFKPNPVNEKMHSISWQIFRPLIEKGYLQYVVGGVDVGTALVGDNRLDEIVLTGSVNTYDKIKPLTKTPIVAELGGVNPWIVVPGKGWSKRSVDLHARHLAFAKLSNNGHTCAAPQILVLPSDWDYRDLFLNRVHHWLSESVGSPSFYPGSHDTHKFFRNHKGAEMINQSNIFDQLHHPIVIRNVSDVTDKENPIFSREAFCPVLAEVALNSSAKDSMVYLRSAIKFVEEHCFGSLSANIIIPDNVAKNNAKEFDSIVAEMNFGIVGINLWTAYAYSMPNLIWGASSRNSQSGIGFLGNSCLFENPSKTILRAPFNWLGRRVLMISPPSKQELIFRRYSKYRIKPNLLTQTLLFSAIFLNL